MKKNTLYLFAIVVLLGLASMAISTGKQVARATGNSMPLAGWAWSSNIGWLSFNSNDQYTGTGSTGTSPNAYGVTISTSSPCSVTAACLSGNVWSSNIGWISFDRSVTNNPPTNGSADPGNGSGPIATVNMTTGAVTGWARALAGCNGKDSNGAVNWDGTKCNSTFGGSDNGTTTPGWDGWIELSGTNHATGDTTGNGGVTYLTSGANAGSFVGYAWGGPVVGWVNFFPNPTGCTGDGCGAKICDPTIDPTCNGGGTTPDVSFNVISAGLPATSATVGLTGSSASANVQWSSANVVAGTCSLVGSDWSHVSNQSAMNIVSGCNTGTLNSAGLQFTGVTDGQMITLSIKAQDPTPRAVDLTQSIQITFSNQVQGQPLCNRPANTNVCTVKATNGSPTIWGSSSQCSATSPSCEFYCMSGYILKNGACVKSSLQEI